MSPGETNTEVARCDETASEPGDSSSPSVAVVHMDLMSKGGGEAVAMNALEALQAAYDVTLITLTDPDIPALNDFFNTSVDAEALTVRRAGVLAPTIHETFGLKYYVLQNALLGRYARRHADEFDLLVSTINELGLETDSVQYVHFPFDWTVSCADRDHIFHPTVEDDSWYERLCTRVAGVSRRDIQANTLFANSEWTAEVVEDAYGTKPEILHPPIDTSEFVNLPWEEREDGFVTVGRIERSKRIAEMIRVVDGVRERGHDVHFHVIGPTVDEEYREEVAAMAAEREYVELEGEVPRSELVERICTHKYGIHGKEYEHFGMAVAELAAGGTVPFIPSNGGQHAIVRDEELLMYDSPEDAVEKIAHVLEDESRQRELRMSTREIERRFGRRRFKRAFRDAVDDALAQSGASEREPAATVVSNPASNED
ncbi:glycosyltransferase family 1 protein [Halopelagius longus]|uniref:Glycosyl transferases group 1 n=2 Tax=Halopelagius longus TaxID=1236180 RepID=A0A1H1C5Q5_9EURY|nr:glycosyltransferase family 1 protein [Halopelagius longus]SDQ59557.1 Glycosyl transferases group 1 [Halopelagius longus]